MRLLFYKSDLAWPRASGHDVFTFNTMRAMSRLGARIGLVTLHTPEAQAISDLDLDTLVSLTELPTTDDDVSPLSGLQERYRSYWGVQSCHVNHVGALAQQFQADVVVACGLDALPMLGAVEKAQRVWYAADEWVLHHVTLVRLTDPRSWTNLRAAAVKGLYERAFRRKVDRVWVVSMTEARAMRWIAGIRGVDVLRYGVDFELYKPMNVPEETETAVFWGRLDFGPNIQALEWFCRHVWPLVRRRHSEARFTIVGFHPTPEVQLLADIPGVTLRPNLEDIRPEVGRHEVVVLPFISGAGIKNKLLEAAAMGKPIVCSPRALLGLGGDPPVIVARKPEDWIRALTALWLDREQRDQVGRRLRSWVISEHGWDRSARIALEALARNGKNATEPQR